MAKSTNLSLVEDEPQIVEGTAEVVEEAQPVQEEVAPTQDANGLAQQVSRLESYLQIAEARLARLEQMAHVEHQIDLGPDELAAIGNALKAQTQQVIIDHLKEHLGMAPPAIKGS
jgi:hypothetical protein